MLTLCDVGTNQIRSGGGGEHPPEMYEVDRQRKSAGISDKRPDTAAILRIAAAGRWANARIAPAVKATMTVLYSTSLPVWNVLSQ